MPDDDQTYTAAPPDAGQRLDAFLARVSGLSRASVQRLIADGAVAVNGRPEKPRYPVAAGDQVRLRIPAAQPLLLTPEAIPLEILFEDADLLVLSKPAGLVVHPGAGRSTGTLVHALLAHCDRLPGIGGIERPGIVHRLDKDTSGAMVVAKTEAAHLELSRQFSGREVHKRYLALVHGTPAQAAGRIEAPIGRREQDRTRMGVRERGGREARTAYRLLRRLGGMSLLEVAIETGRTHQIRVHLAHLGHPVVGDATYGGKRHRRSGGTAARQMLHAWRLAFRHPRTGERLEFTAPIPADLLAAAGATTPQDLLSPPPR